MGPKWVQQRKSKHVIFQPTKAGSDFQLLNLEDGDWFMGALIHFDQPLKPAVPCAGEKEKNLYLSKTFMQTTS